MLNLKAELVKKQKELNNQKSTNGSYISTANKGPPKVLPWKKNKGVEARNNRDVEHQDEDVDKMKKVHAILEAKSKMYDKLTSGNLIPDKDDTQMFMVDFEQKSIDAWRSKKEKGEMSGKPETKVKVLDDVRKVIDEAKEEWVEYVDSLGRTRTCRKSEIHLLENIDKKLDGKVEPRHGASGKTLMSDDMRREEEREQWEQEERSKMEEEEGPIFYQNIRDGEIRELGVGYYGFSGDKNERDKQMKRLNKMREDTQLNRKKMVQKKEEQRLALQTRLEKIRQRRVKKLLEQGKEIPKSLSEPITVKPEEEKDHGEKKLPEEGESSDAVVTVTTNKTTGLREWDEGKDMAWRPAEPKQPPKSWRDPHEDRVNEFAPPSFYYAEKRAKLDKTAPDPTPPNKPQSAPDQTQYSETLPHKPHSVTSTTTSPTLPPTATLPPTQNILTPTATLPNTPHSLPPANTLHSQPHVLPPNAYNLPHQPHMYGPPPAYTPPYMQTPNMPYWQPYTYNPNPSVPINPHYPHSFYAPPNPPTSTNSPEVNYTHTDPKPPNPSGQLHNPNEPLKPPYNEPPKQLQIPMKPPEQPSKPLIFTPKNPIEPTPDAERIQRLLTQVSNDLSPGIPPKPYNPSSQPIQLKVKTNQKQFLTTKSVLDE